MPRLLRMPKWEGEVDDSSDSLSDAMYHLNISIKKNSGKEMLTIAVVQILLTRAVCPLNIHRNFLRLVASKAGISFEVGIVVFYTMIRVFRDDVRVWYDGIMVDGLSF